MKINESIEVWEHEGIIKIRIPMAPPLRWVNSYLLRDTEGLTLVDPGPHTDESIQQWAAVWQDLRLSPQDISAIVVTHHHPDHYGLSGHFQSISGAPVYMSERAAKEAARMWGAGGNMNDQMTALFSDHGMPPYWTDQLPEHLDRFLSQVTPAPKVTYVSEGGVLRMGGRSWEIVETAGHASGHLSFYDRNLKIVLCGDAVLPQISPNISLVPGGDGTPLQSFMDSLIKLGNLKVDIAFPGHRHPFQHFQDRLDALYNHHIERLARIEDMIRNDPHSGFEVCVKLFGTDLGIHQMRFAMSEALAHLVELVRLNRAAVVWTEGESGITQFVS